MENSEQTVARDNVLNDIFTVKIFRNIFKFYRSKDLRIVNKFFCKIYDEFDEDYEEFKHDDQSEFAEHELYQQIKHYCTGNSRIFNLVY